MKTRRFLLALLLCVFMPFLFGASMRYAKTAALSMFPGGLPSADNLALKSDGTTGAIQGTDITISDAEAEPSLTRISSGPLNGSS